LQAKDEKVQRSRLSAGLGGLLALVGLLGELGFPATPVPVGEVAVSLGSLGAEVGQVAGEEQVVRGSDGEGVAHECSSVDGQSGGHRAGDTVSGGGLG